jgi:phosphohistidine phosphatase
MNLYLVRHADALPVGEQGVTADADRPLSERGRQQAHLLAQGLKRLGVAVDQVLTSPLRRAVETAEELARTLQSSRLGVVNCEALGPGTSPKKLAKHLLKVEGENIMLVGHEPGLSRCTAWLIGDKDARLEFSKGGAACVLCDVLPQKKAGTLQWLFTSKWLKALSSAQE